MAEARFSSSAASVTLHGMKDSDRVRFLQWALPRMRMRWRGFRKVRRQVCRRVDRRLVELGLAGIDEYMAHLDSHPEEWLVLDGFCRISISRFYRDRGVFNALGDEVLPRLASIATTGGHSVVRSWHAGCASGEEVYTLRIVWQLAVAPVYPGVELLITATDADPHMLQRARIGRYPRSSLKDLPRQWLLRAFQECHDEFRVRDEFRSGAEFILQDIRRERPEQVFDIIFCRHLVFTYFDESLQTEILEQLLHRLRAGGVLVTGKQESLPADARGLEPHAAHLGVYWRTSRLA